MPHPNDPFAHAENTAHTWLAVVRDRLGTDDRQLAYRVLRAWLHTVRDRLTVEAAAHFAAQLPELLRGVFYEGWNPSHVPTRYGVSGFVARFAGSGGITRAEVPPVAAVVTSALDELCSPGQLDHVLTLLPESLVTMLTTGHEVRRAG
ncbi:DUF2267 domain-containing protein [Amycolatopsis mongoliensis]|uniref:DUF2267 domain-containing protein n=1 Tax=Amycolatopsis mongoliensis TaxID=715475 RepID=A0A9Y2JN69_9PSEU|nr:DUF2267 domain-containing protein [Amycolatopsis sp. 4-36]WIY00457.1 DUF2267 domain-containing protein [Amycolatopsis sp. 4-36]